MLPVAVIRSSSHDSAICYVLPVFVDDVTFLQNRAYVVSGEPYGRGMSVSGREHREGRS